MKSSLCIAPLLLLQFINLTWALPWDLQTCPLPVPPSPHVQYILPSDVGIDGNNTRKKIGFAVTKIINLLLPRQTVVCRLANCDSQNWCCNDQTYSVSNNKWTCLAPTRYQPVTSTYQSTATSTITSTSSITSTTWNTVTTWTYISSTDVWATTVTVTKTITQTSLTTSSITLTRRGMPTPTPTRCVRQTEDKEKRKRGLADGANPTSINWITITVWITAPASTIYMSTTWSYTYWITGQTTITQTTFARVDSTTTITSTYQTVTTTTSTVTDTTTTTENPSPDSSPSSSPSGGGGGGGGPSIGVKVGAGIGAGVGGLVIIALLAMLIWRKYTKPTAEEEWAGNQPVEDISAPPGDAGPGMAMVGAGGMVLAAGANDKVPYKSGYYDQGGNGVTTGTSPSPPPPAPPPAAYFQPVPYPQGYPDPGPNNTSIHTIPRRPVPGSPPPPGYQG
ncbi:hypothetical protein B9Z19DRAFT_715725 [Tuber borchii]|uniref:Mid2 domain-containing protein n=1 Tax=Tuber borchii TaxID=42251 RepID=A0A2T6Z9W4_TUBBO|nr:hypothetical protein B9Z19DRAFT_715725 [Tuber borchii]